MNLLGGFSRLALVSAGVIGLGTVFTAVPAAANTRMVVPEDVYRLCERRSFRQSELRALQRRPDFALILRYTADNCAGVAAVLSDGATATLPGAGSAADVSRGSAALSGAAECRPGLGMSDSCDPICERTTFTTREIAALQRRPDFAQILEFTLQACPAVAAVLTDTATATLPGTGNDHGDGGNGGTGGGNGGGGNGGGGTGGGGTGGGGTGGGGTGGGGTGGGDGGGTGGGDGGGTGGGGTGGGDGGGTGGGGTGGGDGRPPEPDSRTDPDAHKAWRDQYGPGSGWGGR